MTASAPDDGLDSVAWQIVADMVTAAYDNNTIAYRGAIGRLHSHMDRVDKKFGRYFYYLLWHEVVRIVGRVPEISDMPGVADRAWPKYSLMLKTGRPLLEGMLYDLLKSSTDEPKGPIGVDFIISASVTIGALMYNPFSQLLELRPMLRDWYQELFLNEIT